ncbi:MAG: carbohydrate-binding protein, partial [Chitinivibrionales bacterium]|nr:carbohydrate-binding protein [Chitinivibrionales bacterium]
IKKGDNERFRVWVDDIFVLQNEFEAKQIERGWDEIEETIPAPPVAQQPDVTVLHTVFDDAFAGGAFAYLYGGKTAYRLQKTSDPANEAVLAAYLDNEDYSGVTIALGPGNNIDLTEARSTHAGLAFWAKAAPNVTAAYVGLLDDELDGMKVQTKLALGDYGKLDTNWTYFMVPIKRFAPQGLYWDAARKAEVSGDIKWDEINEIRISVNRYENRVEEGEPAAIYIDNVTIIENIPGWVDPDEYWKTFASDEQDLLLHDFEEGADTSWETAAGPKSTIDVTFVKPEGEPRCGSTSLQVAYKLGDYCDALLDYEATGVAAKKRDWSKHWGLKFLFHTDKPYQAVTVQISDAGKEIFVANAGGQRGWSEILVPFKQFTKFPYYQPEDAEQNGHFDLEGITRVDFKPAGEGTSGKYLIDNITLTNDREVAEPEAPEFVSVQVTTDPDSIVTARINDGLFGINAALWDGDLLLPATAKYVEAVNHAVIRYPGGLRADEDHWREVLDRKDWMVDTDEFLAFCKQIDATAMITVNFGRGTAQEAASWVRHVNVDGGHNVKLWEVGNELYGDWHASHCSAEEYGARTAEFIKAMKAVDPSILVGVVWVLEGEWNKVVFEHTRDLADAVIVHHYPQHAKEENDFALLSAPRSLDEIIPSVREQIRRYGTSGRDYQIWLTEWNSVDFDPGPQILSTVNGLFVIDYLGTLARHNIEQASYWDIHNSMTARGGDYGYLSRTGAPDGDNVPRPSYWAFRLASQALRGTMLHAQTDNDNVSAYLTESEGQRTLLLVNKHPRTTAKVTISTPVITGKARVTTFPGEKPTRQLTERQLVIDKNQVIAVAPFSATAIAVDGDK